LAQTHYAHQLASEGAAPARAFLTERLGLPPDAAERYSLGWADGSLHTHLIDELHLDPHRCIAAGLIERHDDGDLRDVLHACIVIPDIVDGEVVHLAARPLDTEPPAGWRRRGEWRPDWRHIPGPPTRCYNEDAYEEPDCIIVETPLHAIALREWGHPALAIYGSEDAHTDLLRALVDRHGQPTHRLYTCFPGDEEGSGAGWNAARMLGPQLLVADLWPYPQLDDILRDDRRHDLREFLDLAHHPKFLLTQHAHPDADPANNVFVYPPREEQARVAQCLAPWGGIPPRSGQGLAGQAVQPSRQAAQPYTALFDGLIDVCVQDGRSVFLSHGASGPSPGAQASLPAVPLGVHASLPASHLDNTLLLPPPPSRIPWLLPRADEVLRWFEDDTDAQLFADLAAYHQSISELPGDGVYDLLAAWTMHTYLLEHCDYSPILYLWGAPERGKTRTGRGLAYVAYRGLHMESLREACLTRIARDFRATLFIDVHDLARKARRERADDALLQRFEKRAIVPRVLRPLRGPHEDMEYLRIFGATVIATNEPPHEHLRSRCLVLT
ncbi:MAG: hypothetical protein ACE5JM_16920, partial [Armatimonadota bacterium]